MFVRAGDDPVHQVPLTYRGAPLDGGDDSLIGATEHSVLGQRWVYDACGIPSTPRRWRTPSTPAAGQAGDFFEVDGRLERREPSMVVVGGGAEDADAPPPRPMRLVASWRTTPR